MSKEKPPLTTTCTPRSKCAGGILVESGSEPITSNSSSDERHSGNMRRVETRQRANWGRATYPGVVFSASFVGSASDHDILLCCNVGWHFFPPSDPLESIFWSAFLLLTGSTHSLPLLSSTQASEPICSVSKLPPPDCRVSDSADEFLTATCNAL